MWRPSKYQDHNQSLGKWLSLFNSTEPKTIKAEAYDEELFIHDGLIDLWESIVGFDWEKRQDWVGSEFPFSEVGQFTRKFSEEKKIDIAIMCNLDESYFLAAWHKDFGDKLIPVARKTDFQEKESGFMRTCGRFKVFNYQHINAFKNWLLATYPEILKRETTP